MDHLRAEADLVEKAKTDPEAFGELYEKYIERIYNYVYFRVGSVHDAEDLTARVFLKALNSLNRYRFVGLPFSAWLYRIAHNLIANHHRDQSRRREIPIEDMAVVNVSSRAPSLDASVGRAQETEALWKMINDLSPQKRELILLKFVEKLSNSEIAAVLKKSESAIKSLYHRTLLEMRERMDGEDY
ncbi:MAG: sigma-70 family RNA polymerase sigma factor [Chloroflexi bacterium]|nr:sigma-70 family RNA polymerase sigma factor [Anaerolineaceae bacterium]NLI44505.1 sigma-70 family RNA polymerase sigma factor [Chloroflexota bacterium]HOE35385.1 sigma-70 family RNA polymerase sigma factor [Anaerolineaceae bacterium]HOT26075.1 sigma-70 family RNA polymerase sigma factor [Anaerolineaceae bacterium]HQL28224.1 sigma-70 family RNA polymerase sigma factor [Anaerolineaceae bacterium]